MGIPDHLTCLLRNVYAGQEATVRIGQGIMDWFKIRKDVHQSCLLSPCLFTFYAEYIMWNVRWMNHKLELRLPGKISITSDMQNHPYGRKQRETKEPLDESVREEWKSWLKTQHSKNKDHGIQSHHFMVNQISSWGKKRKWADFIFLGFKMTAAVKLKDACSLEEKLWQT